MGSSNLRFREKIEIEILKFNSLNILEYLENETCLTFKQNEFDWNILESEIF